LNIKKNVEKILIGLAEVTKPETEQLTSLLKSAIIAQREFFSNWHEAVVSKTSFHSPSTDQSVRQSSSNLQQLYSVLMQRYPNESANNLDAFYQHLCALDFL